MGVRKSHPIPAEHSVKLRRNLELARRAAYELSKSPWFRDQSDVQAVFNRMFLDIAAMQKTHSDQSVAILDASQQAIDKK